MRSVFPRLSVLFVFLCFCAGLFAQTTSLNGTVTDPSGAVIPSAVITIANLETGLERTEQSDTGGRYVFAQLPPGNYKLTAKAAGFSDVVIDKIELLVNQPATIPIPFVKVGSTTQTVQVEAAATQVNTTDASLGNAVDNNTIVQMPMYQRNVAGLLALQPGVTSYSSFGQQTPGTLPNPRDGSVNGGKPDQGNITLDGADVNDQNARAAFTTVLRVSLDSVVYAYLRGESRIGIAESFTSLSLDQIDGAIKYYLENRAEVDAYLERQRIEHERMRQESRAKDPAFYAKMDAARQEFLAKRR